MGTRTTKILWLLSGLLLAVLATVVPGCQAVLSPSSCPSTNSTLLEYTNFDFEFGYLGANYFYCLGNSFTGATKIYSFGYWLKLDLAYGVYPINAFLLDPNASPSMVVDQVLVGDYTVLGIDQNNYVYQQPTFPNPPTLNPTKTYYLVFCANVAHPVSGFQAGWYMKSAIQGGHGVGCSSSLNCAVSGSFPPLNNVYSFTTKVNYTCDPPSPSPTPSRTPSRSPTPSRTSSPSTTPTPSISISPSPTSSISVTPSVSISNTPTPSPSSSVTPTISQTPSVTPSVTPTPSSTSTPSPSSSNTPSTTPTPSPTQSPTPSLTRTPSITPTSTPSNSRTPTSTPSASPTQSPTSSISRTPSPTPTVSTSNSPTSSPTPSTSASSSPSSTPSTSPSSSPIYIISDSPAEVPAPVLQLNYISSEVIIQPKDAEGNVQADAAVSVSLGQLTEVDAEHDAVCLGSIAPGSWQALANNDLGAATSYLFSADIVTTTAEGVSISSDARLELQFYLFDTETELTVGNVAFNGLPSFAKFTIRLFDWPWQSSEHLELLMKIDPPFSDFTTQANTPQTGVTTFVLSGQHSAESGHQGTTSVLRLIDTIELDGEQVASGLTYSLNAETSELLFSFNYFESTLVYDPDVGVQMASSSSRGGDDVVLIVCLTVILPVFALFAVLSLLIVAAVLVAQRRFPTSKRDRTMHAL